jgi:hypothetical protein
VNSKEVLELIQHPEKLQKAQAEQLERVLADYPYSGVLHALYLKALKNQNNYLYPKQLKRTAIAVQDRKALYYWVEAESEVIETVEKPKIEFHPEVKATPAAEVPKPIATPLEAPKPATYQPPAPVPPPPVVVPVAAEIKQPPPVVFAPKAQPIIAEGDLDLANLPASVRETVLRARRIRQQLGNAFNDATPGEKASAPPPVSQPTLVPAAPAPIPIPLPNIPQEPVLEKGPQIPVEPVAPAPTPEPIKPNPVSEPPVSVPTFEIISAPEVEPVANEVKPSVRSDSPKVRHSFLDWLEKDEAEEDRTEIEVIAHLDEVEEIVPEVVLQPAIEPIAERNPEASEPAQEPAVEQPEPKPSTEEVKNLYESFMEKRPKPRLDFSAKDAGIDTASLGTSDYAAYITETLAQVYVKQKLYNRAINAYEILRLKYPEKSGLFAARISEIKRLINI